MSLRLLMQYIYIRDPERDLALEPATCIASSATNSCLAKSQLIAHSAGKADRSAR